MRRVEKIRATTINRMAEETGKFCEECGAKIVRYEVGQKFDGNTGERIPIFGDRCSANCAHGHERDVDRYRKWRQLHDQDERSPDNDYVCRRCGDVYHWMG